MIIFRTETGSTYEVDREHKRIRRLSNAEGRPCTERQGADGIWKTYAELELKRGKSAMIVWRVDETREGPIARCTETSRVTSIGSPS